MWQHHIGSIKFIDGKTKRWPYISSTLGDIKDSDVKSRFNEETKRNLNMIIDYNKSMGGVDKLD